MPLASESWYRHHAVLMALAVNERLLGRDGVFDPIWANALFTGLLGIDARGSKGQRPAIDPYAFPRSVRSRLAFVARSTEIEAWSGAKFKSGLGSGASRTGKLVASLVHRRDVPPRTLWRIACGELSGTELPPVDEMEQPLADLSAVLCSARPRSAKLQAVALFIEAAPSLRRSWPALEPALVQPLLDWVPAVIGEAGPMARPGVMVPLMVEVGRRGNGAPVLITGALQDTGTLERSVEIALRASCSLWRGRHSNGPDRRLREVAHARVKVDMQLVEGIAQACIRAQDGVVDLNARPDLEGRSLELPLALAIYDRLVGSREHGEVRASGMLGMRHPDKQDRLSGDTDLDPVTGERSKALAAEEELADRVILAQGSDPPATGVPIVFAATLGAAVDHAFGGGGDGHRFVRSPDLAAGFKRGRFAVDRVERFKKDLRCGSVVLKTNQPLGVVAQALFDVNQLLGKERFRSKGRYTFVRLSPTERGDAAWASIWSAIDGDAADFAQFTTAWSPWRRSELFARQLSRNAASMADPRWSPHVLILAGVPSAETSAGLKGGAFRRFDIRRIMNDVETLLSAAHSPCDPWLRACVGATRVILVDDDGMKGFDEHPPELEADLDRAVECLSAFRYGFSFDMARRQLGTADSPMPVDDCKDILEGLQEVLCDDGLPLLVAGVSNAWRQREAPTAFTYLLRHRQLPAALPRQLALHERAAHAIAPILHPGRSYAHVDLAAGLSAGWLDEAYSQLTDARAIAVKLGNDTEKTRLSTLRLRLLRLSGWFILERLPAMMGRNGDEAIYEDFADRLGPNDHPALQARAAAFATILASNAHNQAERRRFYLEALRHLNDGAKACGRLDDLDEREGATFLIASERCRLAHVGRGEPDHVLAPAYRNLPTFAPLALEHLPYMRELYWAEWFPQVAALIEDDAVANRIYRAGLWNEALPGGPQAGDDTLIGWAGTLDAITPVDPGLLRKVKVHLKNGFFRRRDAATRAAIKSGEQPTPRTEAGLVRLRKIAAVARN